MTKLCDTCEYLKFCARSGIEEVGCDRYKKDTTTHKEWLQTATTEQLAEFLACVEARRNANYNEEVKAWVEWLKQPHKE